MFYRQSDIPEIPELTWLLTCMTAKGLMNRAHAYKSAVQDNSATGEDADHGITMGLFSYPILMAADILMFNAQIIPVGRDQVQHVEMARDIESADSGIYPFPIDPTRGAMLALLVQVPDLKNRIEQGGLIGYVILIIGFVGLLLAIERLIVLFITARKVNEQLNNDEPDENALGRIMLVYKNNPEIDAETLGLKLDEAILKEMPKLQRGLWTIALLAAVSPLLGLLGTVTGIIETFQSITLYGTGDPRVMSGGISQALVTTVMGLLVAIPLLLFHGYLSSKSNTLIQILDEKSMAFVALLAEENRKKVFGQSQYQNVKKEDKTKSSNKDKNDEPEFFIPDNE